MGKRLSGRKHLLCSPEDLNSNHQHPCKAIQTWLKMSVMPSLVGQTHKVPESLGPCLTERSRFQFTEKPCLRQQNREHQKTPLSCPLVCTSYNSNIKSVRMTNLWSLAPNQCPPSAWQSNSNGEPSGSYFNSTFCIRTTGQPVRGIISACQDSNQDFTKNPTHPRKGWVDFSAWQEKWGP